MTEPQTPPAALPDVLLPYQQRLIAAIDANPVVVVEKSRRIGATWGVAAGADLTAATARAAGGMDVLYIGYNLDMAREFVGACAMWARAFNYAAGDTREALFNDGDRDIKAFRIDFASGFELMALSSRPRSLRGRQGLVIIDEAAFHDELGELLKAALALLMWGGKVVVLSTHNGDANPYNGLVNDCRAGRVPYDLIRVTFDDAVAEGLYKRICLVTGKPWSPAAEAAWVAGIRAFYRDDAAEELDCIPSQGSGTWLSGALIESRMRAEIPVVRWEQPAGFAELAPHLREAEARDFCETRLAPLLTVLDPTLRSYFGEDFGRVADLTVFWPMQVDHALNRRTPFIVELRNIPFEQQKQILFYIVHRLPRFVSGAMDATGNGAYLAEVAAQEFGFGRIDQVKLSVEWYRENMPKARAAIEDGVADLPRDADVLGDFRSVKVVQGVAQVTRLNDQSAKGKKRHGDAAVAFVMAWVASVMDVVEYGYTPVPARPRLDEARGEWGDGDGGGRMMARADGGDDFHGSGLRGRRGAI